MQPLSGQDALCSGPHHPPLCGRENRQVAGTGNLGELAQYFRGGSAEPPAGWSEALGVVAREMGGVAPWLGGEERGSSWDGGLVTASVSSLLVPLLAFTGAALLAVPVSDTLKREEGSRVAETLPREHMWLAQTPQMFRIGMLMQALERAGPDVTDEATAIESLGLKPLLVPGGAQNFKVTYPDDFALAEAVLKGRHK